MIIKYMARCTLFNNKTSLVIKCLDDDNDKWCYGYVYQPNWFKVENSGNKAYKVFEHSLYIKMEDGRVFTVPDGFLNADVRLHENSNEITYYNLLYKDLDCVTHIYPTHYLKELAYKSTLELTAENEHSSDQFTEIVTDNISNFKNVEDFKSDKGFRLEKHSFEIPAVEYTVLKTGVDDASCIYGINNIICTENYLLTKKSLYVKCDDCKQIMLRKSAHDLDDGICVCDNCITKYKPCDYCNKLYNVYKMQQRVCPSCWSKNQNAKVRNYSYKPDMFYYKNDGTIINDPHMFSGIGVELEVDDSGERCFISDIVQQSLNNEVYIKHDGSLTNGFEIVTYPHEIESFFRLPWKDTFEMLIKHGYRSHDAHTCGLHMHVSRNMLTDDDITKIIYFIETHKKDIIKFSRREKAELQRWSGFYTQSDVIRRTPTCKGTDDICALKNLVTLYNYNRNHEYRYKCVNLINKNTVEFRFLRGTLNYNTFMASIDFLLALVRNCKLISWKRIDDTKLWLRNVSRKTRLYMAKRKCFGYTKNNIDEKESDL